jgi:restriction system protein
MRRRAKLLEDVMELAGRLPWMLSLALAALLYVVLHILAGMAPAPLPKADALGAFALHQFARTIAAIAQYALPSLFLVGALASYLRRRHSQTLLANAAADPTGSINNLSWRDFERLVGTSFEREGFAVTHRGGAGADGGVDLVLAKGRETTLVQCKQWRAQKVGVTTVRELYGIMAAQGAVHGIVVSAGEFTQDAREFVRGRNIELVTGGALAAILGYTGGDKAGPGPVATPNCPKCGSRMVERVARKGSSAGQAFWGCEAFPRCRVTLPLTVK